MNVNTNRAAYTIPLILNQNRIEERLTTDAILSMGISICQVGCMNGGQSYRYYRSRH